MYEELVKQLRENGETYLADIIEVLERNVGCPAWDSDKKVCLIMNMPVKCDGED